MPARFAGVLFSAAALVLPAAAQDAPPPSDSVSIGTGIGMVLFILLAVLIGLSVVAKLLIVFRVVPRQAENGFHLLVHGAANVVGGLTRTKPRRRPGSRFDGPGR
jgi:hypothetical protein